ncbi:hypothetical protein CPB83DRAFT_386607 [Crepidotus variabilis]|uniref:Uncharacterized protein n=1 Tax=Crepidotus variabilis TaxID=179855 RepID=A0A9P6JNS0_9AGAR|nr:hypothetical protein CPB83DRAFT_386607 [Crepidotus variabilis]
MPLGVAVSQTGKNGKCSSAATLISSSALLLGSLTFRTCRLVSASTQENGIRYPAYQKGRKGIKKDTFLPYEALTAAQLRKMRGKACN